MYTNILDAERLALLRTLTRLPSLADFYLAGGTALSLQLGLRESHDFDFFTARPFNADALYGRVRELMPQVQPIRVETDTCDLTIGAVQVSFLQYPYPLIGDLILCGEELPGLRLAGIDDISAMKLSAVGGRGSRKDFYDLYQIYRTVPGFCSERLLENAHRKFGADFDLTYMLMGLNYFDDAEQELLPRLFVEADWPEIKGFFVQEQRRLFLLERARFLEGEQGIEP